MEIDTKKKNIHQGRNLKLARNWKGISQEVLAYNLQLSQKQISEIETKEFINDELLSKISLALEVPLDFLKSFELDDIMKHYQVTDNTFTNTSAENSKDVIIQGVVEEQNNHHYNYPIEDIKELYNKLLEEKDKQIVIYKEQLNELKLRVQYLESDPK